LWFAGRHPEPGDDGKTDPVSGDEDEREADGEVDDDVSEARPPMP
jgi:hypothetical protein